MVQDRYGVGKDIFYLFMRTTPNAQMPDKIKFMTYPLRHKVDLDDFISNPDLQVPRK